MLPIKNFILLIRDYILIKFFIDIINKTKDYDLEILLLAQ